MRKWYCLIPAIMLYSAALQAQIVANFSYKLDNGITVVTEKGWNYCRATQAFIKQETTAATGAVTVSVAAAGQLITGSEATVLQNGAAVDAKALKPGAYTARVVCPLSSATSGTISFDINGVIIKPGMDTRVAVSLYDVQISVTESAKPLKGQAGYKTLTNRYAGNEEQNLNWSLPSFYPAGDHAAKPPELGYYGEVKPGSYDLLINIGTSQRIWLNGLVLRPDTYATITTNLNGSTANYTGGVYAVKAMHFYPAGTAAAAKGKPRPNAKLERFCIDGVSLVKPCPSGTYDILLNHGYGVKYEWRKGVVFEVGKMTEIK